MSPGAPLHGLPATNSARSLWRFVMTQNPFYLLSVCFVLHGTAFWFQQQGGEFSPWPLMALICGYVVLMGVTGVALVRWGRVWDDARSILGVILLLLTELALTFDDVLIRQPKTGTALLLTGCIFSMLTCECILRLTRIRLRWGFRGPLHAMLGLLFLYPLYVLHAAQTDSSLVPGRVYGFHLLMAGTWLLLWRAVRGGSAYIAGHGTPWHWPVFPWAIFAFLGVGLALRGYSLASAFDPASLLSTSEAMTLQSAWAPYFLAPTVVAIALLVLESGRRSSSAATRRVGLTLPLVAIALSCTPAHLLSMPQQQFLEQFQSAAGAPIWIAVLATAGAYAFAVCRGMTAAGTPLWLTLTALSFIAPSGVVPDMEAASHWMSAIAAAVAAGTLAIRLCDSRWWMAAAVSTAFAISTLAQLPLDRLQLLLAGSAALLTLIVLLLDDHWSSQLAFLLLTAFGAGCAGLALTPAESIASSEQILWLASLTMLAGMIALKLKRVVAFWMAGTTAAIGTLRGGYELTELVRSQTGWEGVHSFAAGMLLFGIGVAISIRKARQHIEPLAPSDHGRLADPAPFSP